MDVDWDWLVQPTAPTPPGSGGVFAGPAIGGRPLARTFVLFRRLSLPSTRERGRNLLWVHAVCTHPLTPARAHWHPASPVLPAEWEDARVTATRVVRHSLVSSSDRAGRIRSCRSGRSMKVMRRTEYHRREVTMGLQACSSKVERCYHMAEVGGSIPSAPTTPMPSRLGRQRTWIFAGRPSRRSGYSENLIRRGGPDSPCCTHSGCTPPCERAI